MNKSSRPQVHDAHLQCGRAEPHGRLAPVEKHAGNEGELHDASSVPLTQADPNSEKDANDGGGAGLPIRARQAVRWLEAIWLGSFSWPVTGETLCSI
jgi:hypothetical protein